MSPVTTPINLQRTPYFWWINCLGEWIIHASREGHALSDMEIHPRSKGLCLCSLEDASENFLSLPSTTAQPGEDHFPIVGKFCEEGGDLLQL